MQCHLSIEKKICHLQENGYHVKRNKPGTDKCMYSLMRKLKFLKNLNTES